MRHIDLPIAIRTPPPNANNGSAQGERPLPRIPMHVHCLTCSHAVYVSCIIYRPDDEISASATHKQYLVSYNFVNLMMGSM